MTELAGCGEIRQALGVYVVGAIEPAERVIVDAHLSHCADCREELAGLAGLPALLGRVPLEDAERLALDSAELRDLEEPPAELLDSLLGQVSARRRARRWRGITAAAAAAVIAVGGGIGGGLLISHAGNPAVRTTSELVRGSNPATHVSATVYYAPTRSGTNIQVQAMGIPGGTRCEFWVRTASGQPVLVDSWTVGSGHYGNWYRAWAPIAAAKVTGFDVSSGGKVLVTVRAT